MWKWLSEWNLAKVLVPMLMAVVGSWYDLKTEVKIQTKEIENVKQTSALHWDNQRQVDEEQNKRADEMRQDIKDGFNRVERAVRDARR